jgi:hypothetical protein
LLTTAMLALPANWMAAIKPAPPAPTMTASKRW